MGKSAAGRMFQDMSFTVKSFKGKRLEKLIGVEHPDSVAGRPILVYIQAEGTGWHQYFLDVCFGVWENWGEIEKDEAYNHVDYAIFFDVEGQMISSVYCKDNEITIEFESKEKLVLKYLDPEDWDGETEMIKI